MPVFWLDEDLLFPSPELADEDGLLAVGGDLSEERLLLAYSMGIFPWFSGDTPILWWSPDPRLVLMPDEMKISRSLRRTLQRNIFRVTFDAAFEEVINNCASAPRREGQGTWITDGMIEAYCGLYEAGVAHSAESWYGDELAGGLYGVALGGVFFGESMFTRKSNASKAAFVTLVSYLKENNFRMIDCQVRTSHLINFGAREIPRSEFNRILKESLQKPNAHGKWNNDMRR